MNRSDWVLFAWVWMAGMTCLGIGLLVIPAVSPLVNSWTREGLGTALLLVAASILFVAVFEGLPKVGKNAIVIVASSLAAIFGYAGTIVVLEGENPFLMVVFLVFNIYLTLAGVAVVLMGRIYRATSNGRS